MLFENSIQYNTDEILLIEFYDNNNRRFDAILLQNYLID